MPFTPGFGHGRAADMRQDGVLEIARQAPSLRSSHSCNNSRLSWPTKSFARVDKLSCRVTDEPADDGL